MKYLKNAVRAVFAHPEDVDGAVSAEAGAKHTLLGFPVEVLSDGWRFDAKTPVARAAGALLLRSLLTAIAAVEAATGAKFSLSFQERKGSQNVVYRPIQ